MTWQEDAQHRYQHEQAAKAAREEMERQQVRDAAKRQADGLTKVQAHQPAREVTENANGLLPPGEQEQHDLVALFQAFLKLKNAPDLRLHFYADASGGLVFTGGIYDRQIAHWHDMGEGLETVREMLEESEDAQ